MLACGACCAGGFSAEAPGDCSIAKKRAKRDAPESPLGFVSYKQVPPRSDLLALLLATLVMSTQFT